MYARNQNQQGSERIGVLDVVNADNYAAGTQNGAWVDMSRWNRLLALVAAGDLGAASGTLTAKLQQATSSGGAGVKDIPGKAITQFTAAGTDSNKQALINLHEQDLDIDAGFRWVRLSMSIGTGSPAVASDCEGLLLGFDPEISSAHVFDSPTVDEIVP